MRKVVFAIMSLMCRVSQDRFHPRSTRVTTRANPHTLAHPDVPNQSTRMGMCSFICFFPSPGACVPSAGWGVGPGGANVRKTKNLTMEVPRDVLLGSLVCLLAWLSCTPTRCLCPTWSLAEGSCAVCCVYLVLCVYLLRLPRPQVSETRSRTLGGVLVCAHRPPSANCLFFPSTNRHFTHNMEGNMNH